MIPYQAQMLSTVHPSWRPNVEIAPNCPRCDSSITKFCYYNNYSLSQPRYFCKGCRRYWTRGGALRNIPVGGGCRKTERRSKSAVINRSAAGSSYLRPDLVLDGMGLGQNQSSSTASDSSASEASSIDMAELYAKYLNPKTNDELIGKKNDIDHNSVECAQITEELFVGELDFCIDGADNDYFFNLSTCTAADSAFALPGSSDGFEIGDQSVLSNQYWSNYEESSFEAIYPS